MGFINPISIAHCTGNLDMMKVIKVDYFTAPLYPLF
jgi:hypothetical protein